MSIDPRVLRWFLLSNTADSQGDKLGGQIMQTLAGKKVEPTKFEAEMTFEPEDLQRLVGRYRLNRGTVINVMVVGNRMQVQFTGQLAYRVYPEDLMNWNFNVVKAKLTFNLDKPGPSGQVTLEQNYRWTKARRIN
ncbi:MAG: hypothetical protein GY930_21495 [bacterium]|nr:hypothetical protein [bacterium]